MLADNPKNLQEKLETARRQLDNVDSREELLAISAYIYMLEDSIGRVFPDSSVPISAFRKTKSNRIIDSKWDTHEEKMLKNFLLYKDFHKNFFEGIQKKTFHELRRAYTSEYFDITDLSEEDFYNIFFEFMNKIGLSKTFDKFVKNKRIYTSKVEFIDGVKGFLLFNPISKDSDIFMDRLEYDVPSMVTLAHEFGHVYDMNHFIGDAESYNRHTYESFNDEAISKTFERLFVDFLIENNILVNDAKDQLFDILIGNYEFILTSYIISLIPDNYLSDSSYLNLTPTKIYKLVGKYFSKNNNIRKFINQCSDIDIHETYRYSYGDIFSIFLKERIKDNNYGLDPIREFTELREDLFTPEMLDKLNIDKKGYVKLYKKDIDILKK